MINRLSRRAFLKRSSAAAFWGLGVGAAGSAALAGTSLAFPEPVGRAFGQTAIYAAPDESSPVCAYLAPESTTPILARSGERWYQVPGGYVLREAIQPILPYYRPTLVEAVGDGFWAEVVAPTSVVREWCAGPAPVITRLGFGAVVYVVDRLVDDHGQIWYGLAAAPGSPPVGWAAALQYDAWNDALTPEPFPANIQLRIQQGSLLIEDGPHILAKAGINGPRRPTGKTALRAVQPGASLASQSINTPLGLPWLMQLETGQHMYGTWWHNRFGLDASPDIELPTLVARWLYGWLVCHDSPTMLTRG